MAGLQCKGVSFFGFEFSMELKKVSQEERLSSNFMDKSVIVAQLA